MTSRTPDQALFDFVHQTEVPHVEIVDDPMPIIIHAIKDVYAHLREAAVQNLPETREHIELAFKQQFITAYERVELLQLFEHAI